MGHCRNRAQLHRAYFHTHKYIEQSHSGLVLLCDTSQTKYKSYRELCECLGRLLVVIREVCIVYWTAALRSLSAHTHALSTTLSADLYFS